MRWRGENEIVRSHHSTGAISSRKVILEKRARTLELWTFDGHGSGIETLAFKFQILSFRQRALGERIGDTGLGFPEAQQPRLGNGAVGELSPADLSSPGSAVDKNTPEEKSH